MQFYTGIIYGVIKHDLRICFIVNLLIIQKIIHKNVLIIQYQWLNKQTSLDNP
jgi:hypothetical protein